MGYRWPDLAVLELLVAVERTGSLSAAAREVGMAQPNASRAIRAFERDLGLSLVRRDPRGSRLTGHGALVAEWAAGVLAPARSLLLASASLRADADAHLSVAASRTVAEYAAPTWLSALRAEHPEVVVTLAVDNSAAVCRMVVDGACDLGFVESPTIGPGLRSTTVATDQLVVVVAPGHPWTRRRRPVTAADLAATPLVCREPGSGTRDTLERAIAGTPLPPPALELASNEAVRISVATGAGPAVLSRLAVAGPLATGQLVEVDVDGLDLTRPLRAAWPSGRRPTGPAGDLTRIARSRPPG